MNQNPEKRYFFDSILQERRRFTYMIRLLLDTRSLKDAFWLLATLLVFALILILGIWEAR